jgi:hypothetical protein
MMVKTRVARHREQRMSLAAMDQDRTMSMGSQLFATKGLSNYAKDQAWMKQTTSTVVFVFIASPPTTKDNPKMSSTAAVRNWHAGSPNAREDNDDSLDSTWDSHLIAERDIILHERPARRLCQGRSASREKDGTAATSASRTRVIPTFTPGTKTEGF